MRALPAKYNLALPAGTFYTAGETPCAPRASQAALCFAGCGCAGQRLRAGYDALLPNMLAAISAGGLRTQLLRSTRQKYVIGYRL